MLHGEPFMYVDDGFPTMLQRLYKTYFMVMYVPVLMIIFLTTLWAHIPW